MKRIIVLLLSVLMVLSLVACSSNKPEPDPAPSPKPAEEKDPTPDSGSDKQEKKFARGSWDASGKSFINESTDIKLTIGADYYAYTDVELAQNYLGSEEDIGKWTDEDYAEEINIPDCAFVNGVTGSNVGILYENLKKENALGIDEDTYLSVSMKQLGSNDNFWAEDPYDLTLCNVKYRAQDITYSTQGMNVCQTIAVRKLDNYMSVIIFTTVNDTEQLPELIGFFN